MCVCVWYRRCADAYISHCIMRVDETACMCDASTKRASRHTCWSLVGVGGPHHHRTYHMCLSFHTSTTIHTPSVPCVSAKTRTDHHFTGLCDSIPNTGLRTCTVTAHPDIHRCAAPLFWSECGPQSQAQIHRCTRTTYIHTCECMRGGCMYVQQSVGFCGVVKRTHVVW